MSRAKGKASKETREKMSEARKRLWQDPEYARKVVEGRGYTDKSPEAKKTRSEASKALWSKPGHRERMAARQKESWADPEKRKNRVDGMKLRFSDNEQRERFCRQQQARWTDPIMRRTMIEAGRRVYGRKAVQAAGLPLLRRYVDRACELREQKTATDIIVEMLQREFGKVAA
jgi:hypothetical protein